MLVKVNSTLNRELQNEMDQADQQKTERQQLRRIKAILLIQFTHKKQSQDHVLEIDPELTDEIREKLVAAKIKMNLLYTEMEFIRPSEHQFAVSMCAIGRKLLVDHRQIQTVPASFGKTRIALSICFLFSKMKSNAKVHIVFSNQRMLTREEALYKRAAGGLLDIQTNLVIADAFDRGNAKANEVILIDEADCCIIDQDMKLPTK